MTVRAIATLSPDEIRLLARDQADADEPMEHGFEPGTPQACAWEHAYLERVRELRAQVEG